MHGPTSHVRTCCPGGWSLASTVSGRCIAWLVFLVASCVVLAASAARADDDAAAPVPAAPAAADDGRMEFNFRYQPWQDVLDWFADQADLSLVLDAPPPGTFNYRDSRRYTPAECSTYSTAYCSPRATRLSAAAGC